MYNVHIKYMKKKIIFLTSPSLYGWLNFARQNNITYAVGQALFTHNGQTM